MVEKTEEVHYGRVGSDEGEHVPTRVGTRKGKSNPGVEVGSGGEGAIDCLQVGEHMEEHGLVVASNDASVEDQVVVIVVLVEVEKADWVSLHEKVVAISLGGNPKGVEEGVFGPSLSLQGISISCIYFVYLRFICCC